MSNSGSETRRLTALLKTRVTPEQKALFGQQADKAGVSEAELLRFAAFNIQPLRKARGPRLNETQAAQLIGALMLLTSAIRETGIENVSPRFVEAIHRDIADMRCVLFEALGREP